MKQVKKFSTGFVVKSKKGGNEDITKGNKMSLTS